MRPAIRAGVCAVLLVVSLVNARAAEPVLYRIFLLDGATLVSVGEFARVADRVVFPMPIGAADGSTLQLVTIAESAIDWAKTDAYTTAVRARHYIETRGDNDFAMLGNRVTEALNDVRLTGDPKRQLAMAEEARRNLARWPSENFGYRAGEVAQLVELFDEVIAELRIAAGETGFELSLAAITGPPPPVALLPPPTPRESFEQALAVAGMTPDPAERISLLQAIVLALEQPVHAGRWAAALTMRARRDLAAEVRIDRQYSGLAARVLAQAPPRAGRGEVGGIERLTRETLAADDRLGRRRPQQIAGLLAYLDARLREAQSRRLALDAWAMRRGLFEKYRAAIAPTLDALRSSRPWLDAIRRLAGPAPDTLDRREQRLVMARRVFEQIPPPVELAAAQTLYNAAFQMARRAASVRRNAVSSNDMQLARDASSAAAGALMMLTRADEELGRLIASPNR